MQSIAGSAADILMANVLRQAHDDQIADFAEADP